MSVPVGDTDLVMARFRRERVQASVRGGRIRLSIHVYDTEDEIDRVAELLGSR